MRPSVVGLARRSAGDAARFGGKAARLAQLVDLGFSVPPGFAVGTRVFADLLRSLGREGALEDYPECAHDRERLRQAILGEKLHSRLFACGRFPVCRSPLQKTRPGGGPQSPQAAFP